MGIFFKDAIKKYNSLIIIVSTDIDKSKVRQKSDKFCYFLYVNDAILLRKMLIINELEH